VFSKAKFIFGFHGKQFCFRDSGFEDNLSTYGLISGLWASSFSLGAFVGPSLAGVLFDAYGFQNATYYVLGTQIIVVNKLIKLHAPNY
jgi:MFS family permease